MFQSNGVMVKSATVLWTGPPSAWGVGSSWPSSLELSGQWASYGEIYKRQLWAGVLINKLARAEARLPLKVYERNVDGRNEARDHPYAELLRNPNPRMGPAVFWRWVASTRHIYGEAVVVKERDRGGRPIWLHPIHPTSMRNEVKDGRVVYEIQTASAHVTGIDESDVVHFKEYNPDTTLRGFSRLEQLRRTLENEDASRRATSAFWRNGARPGVALKHPGNLSQPAADRLKLQWNELAGGVDNTGMTVVLEEGMTPEKFTLTAEEAQYIETRKLNREEVCAAYDVPPPVVHILDRATFSNITEQMRSMYRDTMAPILGEDESVLELQLRGSVRPGASEPDFGDSVYAEFLMDEVLRGAFEDRAASMQAAINAGLLTPNEGRTLDNRPALPGGDRLYINSTMVPLDAVSVNAAGALVRAGFEPESSLAALGLPPITHTGLVPVTVQGEDAATAVAPGQMRSLMGRLSRHKSLDEIDEAALLVGMNGSTSTVLQALEEARSAGEDVAGLRARLQQLGA